jgi:hypothetical protein
MASSQADTRRNWRRESLKSGPAGLPAANIFLVPPGRASIDVRDRHAVTKSTKTLNTELGQQSGDVKARRPSTRPKSIRPASDRSEDEEDEPYSPFTRKASHKFNRVGTGDLEDEEDGDSDSSYNSFNLSLQKKALFSEPTFQVLSPTAEFNRTLSSSNVKGESSAERDRAVQAYRIYRSRYEGYLFGDGNLSIQLTAGGNRKMFQRELSKPLFRWVHIENPSMNFSQFVTIALDSPWLAPNEKDSLTSILKVSRQKSDKSLRIPQGKTGSYVEPEYYEERIQQTVLKGFRSRRQKTEIIRWMCLPYFVVGEPTRPTKKQLRDRKFELPDTSMTSAFLEAGYIDEGKHYQVAQMWCVAVGDSLLITSTRRPVTDIPGNQIQIKVAPPPTEERLRSTGDRAPVMIVSDGGIRTWLLPVDTCKTWPEFTAHFAELGVDFSEDWNVLYQDTKLTRRDWPRVMAIAQKSSIRLELQKSRAEDDDDDYDSDESSIFDSNVFNTQGPETGSAVPSPLETQGGTQTSAGAELDPQPPKHSATQTSAEVHERKSLDESIFSLDLSDTWHVFSLLATHVLNETPPNSDDPPRSNSEQVLKVDQSTMKDDCDEADHYLSTVNKRRNENQAYIQCPTKTFAEVREYALSIIPADRSETHGAVYMQLQLMKFTYNIFSFFYPLRYDHIVTRKFWGAVDRMMRSEQVSSKPERYQTYIQEIKILSHVVEDLKEELFSKRSPAHNHTNIPHEFIQAWMLCLMYFILYSTSEVGRSRAYLKRCRVLLTQGKMKVIQRLQLIRLRDREAVSPLGVQSLLIGQLLQDVRGGPLFFDRHQLATMYWADVQQLTTDVRNNPLSRRYQERFNDLKSELETIIATLTDQQRVLVAFEDSINEGESKSVTINNDSSPEHTLGREASIITFSLKATEETLQNFLIMLRHTTEMEAYVCDILLFQVRC